MSKTLIIAEAGVNHNGSLDTAYKLIDVAVEAGVDVVKFQSGTAEKVISQYAPKAEYQKNSTSKSESQLEMCKSFDLDYQAHSKLINYCREKKIRFLSSPFDLDSIDMLVELGLDTLKIPSGEITNLPYLLKIGALNKTIIMSTGMAELDEVRVALDILHHSGTSKNKLTVLHCNTEYPTPFEDVNLNAMLTLRDKLSVKIGYSDHTLGIEIPIAAVAMGGEVIEKHFTLDKNMPGPDHKASLEPSELKAMVCAIRNIEKSLGDGIKSSSPSELKNKAIARKSIVALRRIKKGEMFSENNITTKRPGLGISPMKWNEVMGQIADRDFSIDELIEL
ncbi:N-acetylneuraminate synthase [Nitrospinaceae bacterium]|nr:N-acetylneuraminate synthase [Nitrospinaceae bacterium]